MRKVTEHHGILLFTDNELEKNVQRDSVFAWLPASRRLLYTVYRPIDPLMCSVSPVQRHQAAEIHVPAATTAINPVITSFTDSWKLFGNKASPVSSWTKPSSFLGFFFFWPNLTRQINQHFFLCIRIRLVARMSLRTAVNMMHPHTHLYIRH